MAQERSAAQAAQDKNKDKIGRFTHGRREEAKGVQLVKPQISEQADRKFSGLRALADLSDKADRRASRIYCTQLASTVRENYPSATKVVFSSYNDEEDGPTLTFHSVLDGEGSQVEVDPGFFQNENARADDVNVKQLEERLHAEYNKDSGWARYALHLDDFPEGGVADQHSSAEEFISELEAMSGSISRMEASARAAIAVNAIKDRYPGLEELTLGVSQYTRNTCVAEIVIDGERFANPSARGTQGSSGDVSWGSIDHEIIEANYVDLISKPIRVEDALKWSPGENLV